MLIPNTDRILVAQLTNSEGQPHLVGENLHLGIVKHPGDTNFKEGQKVYYSIYSASSITATDTDEVLYVIAQDDVMAFEDE